MKFTAEGKNPPPEKPVAGEVVGAAPAEVEHRAGHAGDRLAREARRLRPELHVLYASGHTKDAIMRHGRLDDGVELIEKPYRKEMLAGRLAAMLGADAAGRGARP